MSKPQVKIEHLTIKNLHLSSIGGSNVTGGKGETSSEENFPSNMPEEIKDLFKDLSKRGYTVVDHGSMGGGKGLVEVLNKGKKHKTGNPIDMSPEETLDFLHDVVHGIDNASDIASITAAVVCPKAGGLIELLRITSEGKGDGLDTEGAFLLVCNHLKVGIPSPELRATFFEHMKEKEKRDNKAEEKGEKEEATPGSPSMPIS